MTQPYHHGALRVALLEAAEGILDRGGIDALTLRAVAREAGVSHAAPTHHFGDLAGLLTELAASGFVRFRAKLQAEIDGAGPEPGPRLMALGRGYVGFAIAYPGLFRLMFRSERLDWSSPALSSAGEAAFALLTEDEAKPTPLVSQGFQSLVVAMGRWSLVHGLSTLLIDGRVAPFVDRVQGAEMDRVIDAVLTQLARQAPDAGADPHETAIARP
jgi:AcrR family transcriptional regulator